MSGLPSVGPIGLKDVNIELENPPTAIISLNNAQVRELLAKPSGNVSLSMAYGKVNFFTFSISVNTTNANLRNLALSAGWNGTRPLVCVIPSGVIISGNTQGNSTAAMTIDGTFPSGVTLVNNGSIRGRGGNGGAAGFGGGGVGSVGARGGRALMVTVSASVQNNGTIGGGGGGGGGGRGRTVEATWPQKGTTSYYGGGGGGGRSSLTNSGGGSSGSGGTAGGAGTLSAAGSGGSPNGGAGGLLGANGTVGGNSGAAGGPAGQAVNGNTNITWLTFGTRLGTIV